MRRPYPTDLFDVEWNHIEPHLPTPEIARQLARRIDLCYTPVHGSRLNTVEIETSVLVRQCLMRRLTDIETLEREAKARCGRELALQDGGCTHQGAQSLPLRERVTDD
jgi:hypothetical protein